MTHLPTGKPGEHYINPYVVELSPTSRAKCCYCKWMIHKDSVRVGQVNTEACLDDGWSSTQFRHLGCVTTGVIGGVAKRLVSIKAAEGFGALSEANQALVLRVFTNDYFACQEAKEAERVAKEAADAAAEAAKQKKAASAERKAAKAAKAAAAELGEKPAKKAKK